MGRRGPPPQPTVLKLVRGNPGRRPVNESEPATKPGNTSASKLLRDPIRLRALAIWNALAPRLRRMGCFADVDALELATACREQAIGEYHLATHEALIHAAAPGTSVDPTKHLDAAAKLLDRAGQKFYRFGVTPAERSRITTATGGSGERRDPFESYQAARRSRPT